ncbi:MAG: thymidine phosphorylase, partial [Thermoanaerobaculia bacterium]
VEIRAAVQGAADGSWSDAQLGAFLMATAIRGLQPAETNRLTVAMLESGEQWNLSSEIAGLTDKHSTGGVGDKVSLVLSPLLAACHIPVVMLTGRGLGHTGGTADKLEIIPGLDLRLDRRRCLQLLEQVQVAVGVATSEIAPADRRLYALRDQTATVDSIPLITASILSKKLATGAAALVFDVKTGSGAILAEIEDARELARMLVDTCGALGRKATALITDMSQPLGNWVGHAAEVRETLDCLADAGPPELMGVVYALAVELAAMAGSSAGRADFEEAIASGRAREAFDRWIVAQGGDTGWLADPELALAPREVVLEAPRDGVLAAVKTRKLGLLLAEAGGGRSRASREIDPGISLEYRSRLGLSVQAGDELARLYIRRSDERLEDEFRTCFRVEEEGQAPRLIRERIPPGHPL